MPVLINTVLKSVEHYTTNNELNLMKFNINSKWKLNTKNKTSFLHSINLYSTYIVKLGFVKLIEFN